MLSHFISKVLLLWSRKFVKTYLGRYRTVRQLNNSYFISFLIKPIKLKARRVYVICCYNCVFHSGTSTILISSVSPVSQKFDITGLSFHVRRDSNKYFSNPDTLNNNQSNNQHHGNDSMGNNHLDDQSNSRLERLHNVKVY